MQTRLLLPWSRIAIEQERFALEARREAERERDEAGIINERVVELVNAEQRASMNTIAATSHALDALYGELRDVALDSVLKEKWRRKSDSCSRPPSRSKMLRETLKRACVISAPRWESDLHQFFKVRDALVHPKMFDLGNLRKSRRHPLGVMVSRDCHIYRYERAQKAVELLFAILEGCIKRPKPLLEKWVTEMRPSLEQLMSERRAAPG